MAIRREDVLHVAKLANLALDDSEVESLQRNLADILGYIEQLSELNTSDVPPTAHLAVERMPLQEDRVRPSLERDVVMSEAPRVSEGGFAVPAFVDE